MTFNHHRTVQFGATVLAFAMLFALTGCYEKVTYSRQYPGWRVTNAAAAPTAHDYSDVQMYQPNQGSNFDPIGAVFKPVASVARGIGEVGGALGSGLQSAAGNNNDNGSGNANNNVPTNTSPKPSGSRRIPSADTGDGNIGGPSPFDTSPE